MINFQCWKQLLTSKCEIPKDQVDNNDDVHFNYWNNRQENDAPGNCTEGKDESLKTCKLKSGVSKVTWSLMLQLAGIFVMYLFGKL